jgi:preprotein translocase subunit SecF
VDIHNLLLKIFILVLIVSLFGLFNIKLGKDFEGYILLTISSDEPQTFKYPYIERKADKYIYEVSVPLSNEVKQAYKLKTELIQCLKKQENCESIVKNLENLSGLTANNSTSELFKFADISYNKVLESYIELIKNDIKGDVTYNIVSPALSEKLISNMANVFIISSITLLIGLLVLLGYALDTSILLTSKYILEKDKNKAIEQAFQTGLSMVSTSLISFGIIFLIGYLIKIDFLVNIAAVVLIGLVVDVLVSWGLNVYILRKYGEKYV